LPSRCPVKFKRVRTHQKYGIIVNWEIGGSHMTIRRLHGRWLAEHPYAAIRENVARHTNADPTTLGLLAKDRSQPLRYLVAFNPNTPAVLRKKIAGSIAQAGTGHIL
jgi:hypothetical protein